MFRVRLIYRLITVLLIFALMLLVPIFFTTVKQVQKLLENEERGESLRSEGYEKVRRNITVQLFDQMAPFVFYAFITAFLVSIFSLRKTMVSLNNLLTGSQAMRDGNFDVKLDVLTEDELGDVTRAFNDTATTLKNKTRELEQKDLYVNAMLDPLWVVDEANRITDINPAFTRLFGYGREEAVGMSVYDFVDRRNADIIRRQIEDKRERGISSIYELNIRAKNGTSIPVLVSGAPIYSGDRIIAKIGILKDFREQTSLRNDLQQSLDYIETIMDSISDELIVIDQNYKIVMANGIAVENAGRDLTGAHCHQILHGYPVPCWTESRECPTRMVFASGQSHRTVHEHIDVEGRKRFQEIVASPVKDASGRVIHVIELLRDVTARMKDEAEIVRKNTELTALNSISRILSRSLKADEIFSKVLDNMIGMLSMDGGGIFFLDESSKELTCRYHKGISEDYVKMIGRVRLGEDIPGRVAITGQVLTSSDISRDQRVARSVIQHSGMRGYCCIPVKGKEKVVGVFCLFSYNPHVFSVEEENTLSAIGEMTGMALENIRLYEKMRGLYEYQRKRWEDEHGWLLTLSAKLGAAVDIRDIIGSVLGLIRQTFRADYVWMLAHDDSGDLILRFSSKTGQEEGSTAYPADVSSLEKFALSKMHPVIVPDLRSESRFYLLPEVSSYHSAIAVPMFIGDKPVGVYTLYQSMPKDLTEDDIRFLEIIANIMSVAIERSEYYLRAGREKELSDTILQSVNDGIITIDTAGRVIAVNSAFEKMTGISPAMSIGRDIYDALRFSEENFSFCVMVSESIQEAIKGGAVSRSSIMTTLYGNRVPVVINSSPILARDGTVTGIVNLIRDVSREQEIDRMKTELVRGVSHEFRTPLSAIVGMTEMLLQGDVEGDRVHKYLSIIRNEGLRLTRMVSELLSIARIESGKETLKLTRIDLERLMTNVLDAVAPLVVSKGADVIVDAHGIGNMVGDEDKVMQALVSIVDNALTFSDEGCTITIMTTHDGDMLNIRVTDTGWGIPEQDIPHVIEPFYRGIYGDRVKGTGLGLSLCYEIVKMHGGGMSMESTVGKGTTVTLSFPRRENV